MADPFFIVPGDPIADIAEAVYTYTLENPTGTVVADIDRFEILSVQEVMRLFSELPKIERFVNPEFRGFFEVRNAAWPIRTAISAVYVLSSNKFPRFLFNPQIPALSRYNTLIYRAAPNTQLSVV